MNVRTFYYILLLLPSVVLAQRQMVVVNLESKVPVRDVKISTDGGQELRTSWDGLFALPDSFRRLDFHHPDFERRYVLSSEPQRRYDLPDSQCECPARSGDLW